MGKFSGCILACDIDGTTLYNGILPEKNIEAIERFKAEGGIVSIATGRTVAALSPILKLYDGFGPSVVSNGSMIYDPSKDEVLYEVTLDSSELDCIKTALNISDTVGVEIHSGKNVYTVNETKETIDHQVYEEMSALPFDEGMYETIKPNKILYLYTDEEEKQKVNKRVKEVGKKSAFCDTLVTIYGKKRRYLEQMPEGISKAQTLIKMCEMLKIDKNKLFAIGDGFNDIEMLSFAHISACPAEAPDEVKKAADMIVKSAKEGAVADFIDYLFDSI